MNDMLHELDTNLWIIDQPLSFLGLQVGTRMTVVRLPDGKLWLHSPVEPSADLAAALDGRGRVAYLIAPNRFHHLYVGMWNERYPEAEIHLAPELDKKRSDLRATATLTGDTDRRWASALDQVLMRGFPLANEVVFFHRASATLIAADLAVNLGPGDPLMSRAVFALLGAYGGFSATLLERLAIRDRKAFADCLRQVLSWPFERIIVAHGSVLERGGREALTSAYSWLLDGK